MKPESIDFKDRSIDWLIRAFGKAMTATDWVRHLSLNITSHQLRNRIDAGMSPESALRDEHSPYDSDPDISDARSRTTPYYGVSRKANGRFAARIRVGKRIVNVGVFDTAIAAAVAYDRVVDILGDTRAKKNFS